MIKMASLLSGTHDATKAKQRPDIVSFSMRGGEYGAGVVWCGQRDIRVCMYIYM
jgi:hypothetical protein